MPDAAGRNALLKFDAVLLKRYPEYLEGFNEEAFADDEREDVKEVVEFMDDV